MRGETKSSLTLSCAIAISIHSPHARGDAVSYTPRHTPPYFNPLPSCEGRQAVCSFFAWFRLFQSTPLMRGETHWRKLANLSQRFQSTPLMRGETVSGASVSCGCKHFNPLPSCEGRPLWDRSAPVIYLFQSTPLMRGETNNGLCDGFYAIFQSTPLMRGETVSSGSVTSAGIFQSTPLMRGETNAFMIRS